MGTGLCCKVQLLIGQNRCLIARGEENECCRNVLFLGGIVGVSLLLCTGLPRTDAQVEAAQGGSKTKPLKTALPMASPPAVGLSCKEGVRGR
jgi:hypothetical protein